MADEAYWTYQPGVPTPGSPPPDTNMTNEDWFKLSPGMRREIWRQHQRRLDPWK